ncbi:ExeM/NucH family extracellular endonuclease [Microbulbifer bruguierae]|uniref:ExeM/NucH family extracellular endonuclease n=1 Tax=Microbulbifer bruguierae TaxID=3029061 RepID=A0ABY8NHV3_9GAMM|nr:ExeM/NucH family extracellular endonuclease [Microbulbifer bruguierae]WGL18004.1 ExeM/NucH family extracellular endonuclease [Microbulbifer bruguierae]
MPNKSWESLSLFCLSALFSVASNAQLVFSEYIEGSGNNKALEIYNASNATVDLDGYSIQVFFNGATSAGANITLSGNLAAGGIFILGHSSAGDEILAVSDQLYGGGLFNGDDAVALVGPAGFEDVIGQIGVDPGSLWGDSSLGTQNQTLIRDTSIASGRSDGSSVFDPAVEWTSLGLDDFSNLGVHNGSVAGGDDDDGDEGDTPGTVAGVCGDPATLISSIQGSGGASPEVGNYHPVEAIVVASFQNQDSGLAGFFLQEEDTDQDGNEATSEGLFVYDNGFGVAVAVGDHVRVGGVVKEYFDLTELADVDSVSVCGTGNAVSPAELALPFASAEAPESVEGMLVHFGGVLTVNGTQNLGRYGEVVLANGRRYVPTHSNAPGAAALAQQVQNGLNQLLLDDASSIQNPEIIPYPAPALAADSSLRVGNTVADLRGVIGYGFGAYRIYPVVTPEFVDTNPRTSAPVLPGAGSLRVASFNVLNYFNGDGLGGGFPTSRGADSAEEFVRQRQKIIAAIRASGADIIGLMEIENDGYGEDSAIADLVSGLNAAQGSSVYGYVDPGLATLGGDQIAVGLVYRTDTVQLSGDPTVLETYPFDEATSLNRPPLRQAFTEIATGESLSVVVNHFKSKGSCPNDGSLNDDQDDGQGCWNQVRTHAANALAAWLNADPGASGRVLVLGDLNSYAQENPITTLAEFGFTDLLANFMGGNAHSYVYSGESGYLDYALANTALLPLVTGVSDWHINADEPPVLDYNTEFKSEQQIQSLYGAGPYRASDHDPMIVELDLTAGNLPPLAGFVSRARGPWVILRDTSSDEDGELVSWRWDFGDGVVSSERNPRHRYRKLGRYSVTLTVTDNHGAVADITREVTVGPPKPAQARHPR